MHKTDNKSRFVAPVIIIILLIMSITYFLPLLKLGYFPKAHDSERYVLLLAHFKDSFLHGNLYPRWLPDLYGGYGYPTFVFYQPLIFFVSMFLSFLPWINNAYSIYFASWLFLFIGIVGTYFVGLELSKGNKISALFGSTLFLLTPYLAVNIHVRGDFSEFASMCLIPWPIYLGMIIKRKYEVSNDLSFWNLLALSGSIALIMISHPAIALFYIPTVVFLFTLIIFVTVLPNSTKNRIRLLLILYSSILLGIIFSIEYWLPVMQLGGEVHLGNAIQGYFLPYKHALNIKQLFSNSWGYGISLWEVQGPDTMPFQLGLPHFLIALLGLILHRKDKLVWIFFAFYIGFIVIMLLPSPRFWTLPLIVKTQFPWRLLSITAIFQAILSVYSTTILHKHPKIQVSLQLVVVVAIICYTPSMFQPDPSTVQIDAKSFQSISRKSDNLLKNYSFYKLTYTETNEFLPKRANKNILPRGENPIVIGYPGSTIKQFKDNSNHKIHIGVETTDSGIVEIGQFYLPGWKIIINGVVIEDEVIRKNLSKNGTIQIPVDGQMTYNVKAYYDAPPGYIFRKSIIILGFTIFIITFFYLRRKCTNVHNIKF